MRQDVSSHGVPVNEPFAGRLMARPSVMPVQRSGNPTNLWSQSVVVSPRQMSNFPDSERNAPRVFSSGISCPYHHRVYQGDSRARNIATRYGRSPDCCVMAALRQQADSNGGTDEPLPGRSRRCSGLCALMTRSTLGTQGIGDQSAAFDPTDPRPYRCT